METDFESEGTGGNNNQTALDPNNDLTSNISFKNNYAIEFQKPNIQDSNKNLNFNYNMFNNSDWDQQIYNIFKDNPNKLDKNNLIDLKLYSKVNKVYVINNILKEKLFYSFIYLFVTLKIFLLRLLSYSKKIIERLCKLLNIQEETQSEIRLLFFYVLKDNKLYNLFFEKHIDQIIMLCILAIAKHLGIEINIQLLLK